jgi:Zn finger protein HypA/HybF involved in hydrogenase expression
MNICNTSRNIHVLNQSHQQLGVLNTSSSNPPTTVVLINSMMDQKNSLVNQTILSQPNMNICNTSRNLHMLNQSRQQLSVLGQLNPIVLARLNNHAAAISIIPRNKQIKMNGDIGQQSILIDKKSELMHVVKHENTMILKQSVVCEETNVVTMSCSHCHHAKKKCGVARPCPRCVSRGTISSCVNWESRRSGSRRHPLNSNKRKSYKVILPASNQLQDME